MLATRFWRATTVLWCVLLWQSCQTNPLRAVEEEAPAKTPLESGWPPPASEALMQPIGDLPSPPSTTATQQPPIPLTALSRPLLPILSPSAAFADTPLSISVHPTASTTPSRNLLVASDRLPLAAMPRASHAAPLRNTPNGTSSSVFTAASGERVRFSQVEGQWRATLQRNDGSSTSQRTFPVVGPADVGSFLSWLQGQDRGTSLARVHLLKQMPQAPYGPCVYLGKAGLLGGLPASPGQGVSQASQEEWLQGPTMRLSGNEKLTQSYTLSLPPGARFTGYRLQPGSVVDRASWAAWYVGADSEDVIGSIDDRQRSGGHLARISAAVADVIPAMALEGATGRTSGNAQCRVHVSSHRHAALVLYGSTKRNKMFRRRSRLDIALDVSYVVESFSAPINPTPGLINPTLGLINPTLGLINPTPGPINPTPSSDPPHQTPSAPVVKPLFEKEDNHVVSVPPEPCIDFSIARALHEKRMKGSISSLTESESIDLLTMYVSDGAKNAQEIVGKDAVIVVGNTGAGKSTFLNYLLGCRMKLISLKEAGLSSRRRGFVAVSEPSEVCPVVPFSIGHEKESETFMPTIALDSTSPDSTAYCDCPGFMENTGAEINIANAVNIRRILQAARSIRIVILISDKTLDIEADRCRGLTDMLRICTQLFGNADNIKKHKASLLLGVTRSPVYTTIDELQEVLQGSNPENTSETLKVLSDRLFLYDPLDEGGPDFLRRERCLEEIKSLEPIRYAGDLFQTVLDARDEQKLRNIVEQQGSKALSLLSRGAYAKAATCWQTLKRLRVIDQLSVERLLNESKERILGKLAGMEIDFKEACHFYDMKKAKKLLSAFRELTRHFSAEAEEFDLPSLAALKEYYAAVEKRKKQSEDRDRAHEAARIQAAGDKQELLSVIASQKTEMEHIQKELTDGYTKMREELQAELAGREEAYRQSLAATQEELAEVLRRNGEALSLVQAQVLGAEERNRLSAEKEAMKEEYARHIETMNKEWLAEKEAYDAKLATQQKAQAEKQQELQSKIDLLSRQYNNEAQNLQSLRTPAIAFGAKEWEKYLGDVGPAPALPSDIDAVLDGPCPFWPGKKVRDTHLLVLIPATVDGAPFTLNLLGALIRHPKNGGHKTEYRYYNDDTKTQLGEKSPDCSYWLLMTREVLEGSRHKSYGDQKDLVAQCAKKTQQPYELPGVLEAAAAILLHHARTGERLLGDDPWTYTRCRDLVAYEGTNYPAVVGGFDSSGLNFYYYFIDLSSLGVVCSRKF
jgi:50S ribosome-binding GTPase